MIDQLRERLTELDWAPALLQASLLIILLYIILLIPTLEVGPDLAVFSVSLAIVVLSFLNSLSSEKQTKVLEQQQELLERQNQLIEAINEENDTQSDILEDLKDNIEDDDSSDEANEEGAEEATELNADG